MANDAEAAELRLNSAALSVSCAGKEIALTAAEFRVLEALLGQPGTPLSRAQLAQALTQDQAIVQERTVDVHICSLRRKLGAAAAIQTVRGRGYSFGAPRPSG